MRSRRKESGFTLLELMVTVVILSILAVVAVASYKRYSMAARTQEAINFLYEIKMKQESYYQAYGQYVTADWSSPFLFIGSVGDPSSATPNQWEFDCTSSDATTRGWCDLGARTGFNECPTEAGIQCTWFRFTTTGWAPGAPDPGAVTIADRTMDPAIRDTTRRWWYAAAEGDLDFDGEASGYWITSELNQVVELWNGAKY